MGLGFIGAGTMATAIIEGLTKAQDYPGTEITVINKKDKSKIDFLCETHGVKAARGYEDLTEASTTLVLAVKPQDMPEVLDRLRGLVNKNHLVISTVAGITLDSIGASFGAGVPVIRAMPNTPARVGEGVSALCFNANVSDEQKRLAERLFSTVGRVFWVNEGCMDAVTALSGSGPAYFYRLAQEMAKAASEMGLEKHLSERLSTQTLIGAGALLKHSPVGLEQLISEITSPQGTTEAALRVLESKTMSRLVQEALDKACSRSHEISEAFCDKETRRRQAISQAKRLVVKIGTSTIAGRDGIFNRDLVRDLATQISQLIARGKEIVLVSSGAIASGRGRLGAVRCPGITEKQVLSAVGQSILMRNYESVFEEFELTVGQVLLTKDDLGNPRRSALCRNTLEGMLEWGIVPVINENDAVAVEEIRFGDNDSLSAQVAVLLDADLLVLLTDTEGFFTKDPHTDPDAEFIPTVRSIDAGVFQMAGGTHNTQASGGMTTKVWAASTAQRCGIPTVIAKGSMPDVLQRITRGDLVGTLFTGEKTLAQEPFQRGRTL